MKILAMIALIVQLISGGAKWYDCTIYPQYTIVTAVDYKTNTVNCKDFNGNVWSFSGCDDWIENDICCMILCDNGTKNIYDDFILYTRYCGYIK